MSQLKLTDIPADFPVRPLGPEDTAKAKDLVTDGECGLSWDDAISTSWTPVPSGRCPFEYFHRPTPEVEAPEGDASDRQILIAMLSGGEPTMSIGTIRDVARLWTERDYGHADIDIVKLYTLNEQAEPVTLVTTETAGPFGEDDWSYRTVTVAWPDGVRVTAGYRIDGRA